MVGKRVVVVSLFWKMSERIGNQVVQFVISIILARLLLPEEFGVVALIMVFLQIANVFVQNSFNAALIQKKVIDDLDYSSVLYFSLFISFVLYLVFYSSADIIADFYDDHRLIYILKVLPITLFIGSVSSIQYAYVARRMQFKKLFSSTFFSVLISGTVGIYLAYLGYGFWSLVIQQLLNQTFLVLIMFYLVEWRPKLMFSLERIKVLLSFGAKYLGGSLLDIIDNNIRVPIIGKIYNPSMLAFYYKGYSIPRLIGSNINGTIQAVLFPTLSKYQNDKEVLRSIVGRFVKTSSFIILPLMTGLAVTSESLVSVLLTEKWLDASPFLAIFSASYILSPIIVANIQAINAIGRSDMYLKMEIIKKVLGVIVLFGSIPFGPYAIAFGVVINSVISAVVNIYPNRKLLDYGYIKQFRDLMPAFYVSIVMGVVVYSINYLELSHIIILLIQIPLGIMLYVLISHIFKIESYLYIKSTIIEVFG